MPSSSSRRNIGVTLNYQRRFLRCFCLAHSYCYAGEYLALDRVNRRAVRIMGHMAPVIRTREEQQALTQIRVMPNMEWPTSIVDREKFPQVKNRQHAAFSRVMEQFR
jgi:hypothetical protein